MEKGDYENNFPRSKAEWLPEVERQDNALIAWIDEFLASDEYAQFLRERVDLQPRSDALKPKQTFKFFAKTQTADFGAADDNNEFRKTRPDTANFANLALLEKKVQESLIRLRICNTVENQRRGIDIIRNKILEAKRQHAENAMSTMEKNMEDKVLALNLLRTEYHISLHPEDLTEQIVDKVLKVGKMRKTQANKIKRNKVQVVANILRDMRRDQMDKRRKLQMAAGVKTKWKRRSYAKDLDRTMADIPTLPQFDVVDATMSQLSTIPEAENAEEVETTKPITNKPLKKEKQTKFSNKSSSKGSIQGKKRSKAKLSTTKTRNDEKSSKKSQKSKVQEENVIPSQIPNPNPRRKVLPEYVMTELLENITKLYNYLKEKERYEIEDGLAQDILLPVDEGFFSSPNKIIFKDFEPGKRYRKTISLVNGNRHPKIIRHDRIIWNADVDEDLLLEVESFGMRRVLPGMSLRVSLRFSPEALNKTTDGKIIFITNKLRCNRTQQFILHVVCVPLCAAVLISPIVLSFEEMPIWRAQALMKQGKNFKTITITNSGLKDCKVVVTKIFNNQTMEQEWKKIISIIKIDDTPEGERKQLSSSNLEDPAAADPFPRNLVQQCVENVFNVFKFERNVFNVQPKTTVVLKCWLKNVSEAGYQVESYNFSIYERFHDGQLYCIGVQDVIVNSETTSHFLTSNVEYLDFEVCAYGSAYQLDFELTNPCKLAHHIRICFPARMKSFLQANPGVTTILPNQTIKISIKFLPEEGILQNNKFYDEEVSLLEFPVYVTVQTRGYEDTPPLRVDVYAVVTEAQGVALEFTQDIEARFENGVEFYDLGGCTTMESVYVDMVVKNISLVPQQFGFLSLPSFVTIPPNFGFGQLKPMQEAKIQVIISPTKQDIIKNGDSLKFPLVLNTIKHCGALKKRSNQKDLAQKIKNIEDFVCKSRGSNSSKLKEDINELKQAVKRKTVSISSPNSTKSKSTASINRFMQAVDDDERVINLVHYDMEEEKEITSNMDAISSSSLVTSHKTSLNFQISVVDVAVELSHQIIRFPATPCGSYAMMSVDLIPHKVAGVKYEATFEIFGDNAQFEVQPSFGKLSCNRKKKVLWIVVKPNVPERIIEERAQALKREEIEKRKAMESNLGNQENVSKGKIDGTSKTKISKKKSDASKAGKGKSKESVKKTKEKKMADDANLIVVNWDEYYQAEMNIWRTMEPYCIEGMFTCRISYQKVNRPPEDIQFKVSCQVIAPNFIHDQKYQVIDFGSVLIGTSATKTINFQNIQRHNITIDVSPTNPTGPFSCLSSSMMIKTEIPPEYIYSFPIKFTPDQEQSEIEFLDVTSANTSFPFIIRGVGIKPILTFNPNFTVCRISAPYCGFQDCSFDVINECDLQINLYLQKVCELEGSIIQPEVVLDGKKLKSANKAGEHIKRAKFSFDLNDDEIYSLENSFRRRDDSTIAAFHVIDNTNIANTIVIGAHAKCNVKIRFGGLINKAVDGRKDGRNDKDTKSKSGTAQSSVIATKARYFVVKYNLFVGLNYVKDIIIISNVD